MSKFIRTINLLRIVALICLVVTITNAYSDVFEVNLAELGESKTSDEKQTEKPHFFENAINTYNTQRFSHELTCSKSAAQSLL